VTLSAGVAALVPGPGSRPADLVALADAALYRAKGEGRDRIVPADEPIRERSSPD
jgi:PleD family two-component response regulator